MKTALSIAFLLFLFYVAGCDFTGVDAPLPPPPPAGLIDPDEIIDPIHPSLNDTMYAPMNDTTENDP